MIINRYTGVEEILDTINEACDGLIADAFDMSEKSDIRDAIRETVPGVNMALFGYHRLSREKTDSFLDEESDILDVYAIRRWADMCRQVIASRNSCENDLDEQFVRIMDQVRLVSYDDIYDSIISKLKSYDEQYRMCLNRYYTGYAHFWGALDIEKGIFDVVADRLKELYAHADDFIWLYDKLEDNRSRKILVNFLRYWLSYESKLTSKEILETCFEDYFDLDLVKVSDDEVVVELGAFDGDTIVSYINAYHRYKHIYCFEISEANIVAMKEKLERYPNITIINKAAGAGLGTLEMQISDEVDSSNSVGIVLGDRQTVTVEVSSVDEEIREKTDMIIMDIEGAEKDALTGSERHIREDHPKLLISVYHNNEDIWKVARMIYDMDPEYRFWLRSNGRQWGPAEIVLFAL